MYVKLRDAGTIFHDGSQDATVTGTLPVKVKASAKVKEAVKSGVLVQVEDKAAEIEIEKAAGNDEAVEALKSAETDAKVAIKELEKEVATHEANAKEHAKNLADVQAELDESKKSVAELNGKLAQSAKDLEAKDKAYENVKAELAKATKK